MPPMNGETTRIGALSTKETDRDKRKISGFRPITHRTKNKSMTALFNLLKPAFFELLPTKAGSR